MCQKIDFISLLDKEIKDKESVFSVIANCAFKNKIVTSVKEVISGFEKRESQGTTGMLDGFSIPHVSNKFVSKPAVVIVKLNNSIEWESMDGKPIDFIISLLIPEDEKNKTHLKVLSSVSKMLMNDEAKDRLRKAKDENTIKKIINDYIGID